MSSHKHSKHSVYRTIMIVLIHCESQFSSHSLCKCLRLPTSLLWKVHHTLPCTLYLLYYCMLHAVLVKRPHWTNLLKGRDLVCSQPATAPVMKKELWECLWRRNTEELSRPSEEGCSGRGEFSVTRVATCQGCWKGLTSALLCIKAGICFIKAHKKPGGRC